MVQVKFPGLFFLLIVCSLTVIADKNPGYFLSDNHVQGDGFSAKLGCISWVVRMKYNDILYHCLAQSSAHGKCSIKGGYHLNKSLLSMCSVLPAVPRTPAHQDHGWVFLIELTCIWDPRPGASNPVLSAIEILCRNVLRSFSAPSTFPQLLPGSYTFPLLEMGNIPELNIQLWPLEGLPRYWETGSIHNTKMFLILYEMKETFKPLQWLPFWNSWRQMPMLHYLVQGFSVFWWWSLFS